MDQSFVSRSWMIFILYIIIVSISLNSFTANALRGFSNEEIIYEVANATRSGDIFPLESAFDTPCVFYKNSQNILSFEITPMYNSGFLTYYLKNVYDKKVEPYNPIVNNYAIEIVGNHSGNLTIDQICVIYDFLVNGRGSINGWSYVNDPRGRDLIRYANNTITLSKNIGCSGVGDCDDFAILMSSLIESIGGSTRIIRAMNNDSGHAYPEVYLGELNSPNSQVEEIIRWLMIKYETNNIFTHIHREWTPLDFETCNGTKDVWLNLDWKLDENGDSHPGGPFFKGDDETIYIARDSIKRYPLTLD